MNFQFNNYCRTSKYALKHQIIIDSLPNFSTVKKTLRIHYVYVGLNLLSTFSVLSIKKWASAFLLAVIAFRQLFSIINPVLLLSCEWNFRIFLKNADKNMRHFAFCGKEPWWQRQKKEAKEAKKKERNRFRW